MTLRKCTTTEQQENVRQSDPQTRNSHECSM